MILGYTLIEKFKKEIEKKNNSKIYENILNASKQNNFIYIKSNINKIDINLKDEENNTFFDLIVNNKPNKKVLDLFLNNENFDKTKLEKTLFYSSRNNDVTSFENIFRNIENKNKLDIKSLLEITSDNQILRIILNNKNLQKQISLQLLRDLEKSKGQEYTIQIIKHLKDINPDILNVLLYSSIEEKNKNAFEFLLKEIEYFSKYELILILNSVVEKELKFLLNNQVFKNLLENQLNIEDLKLLKINNEILDLKLKMEEKTNLSF